LFLAFDMITKSDTCW